MILGYGGWSGVGRDEDGSAGPIHQTEEGFKVGEVGAGDGPHHTAIVRVES